MHDRAELDRIAMGGATAIGLLLLGSEPGQARRVEATIAGRGGVTTPGGAVLEWGPAAGVELALGPEPPDRVVVEMGVDRREVRGGGAGPMIYRLEVRPGGEGPMVYRRTGRRDPRGLAVYEWAGAFPEAVAESMAAAEVPAVPEAGTWRDRPAML